MSPPSNADYPIVNRVPISGASRTSSDSTMLRSGSLGTSMSKRVVALISQFPASCRASNRVAIACPARWGSTASRRTFVSTVSVFTAPGQLPAPEKGNLACPEGGVCNSCESVTWKLRFGLFSGQSEGYRNIEWRRPVVALRWRRRLAARRHPLRPRRGWLRVVSPSLTGVNLIKIGEIDMRSGNYLVRPEETVFGSGLGVDRRVSRGVAVFGG